MFDYAGRRKALRRRVPDGDILILSATQVPRNYAANTYTFHQDSTFRYYTGLDVADAALWLSGDGTEVLYLTAPGEDDVIWTGPVESGEALAARAGIERVGDYGRLGEVVRAGTHFVEPYDYGLRERLSGWLGVRPEALGGLSSAALRRGVIAQRSRKEAGEVAEIESAIALTRRMLCAARAAIEPGRLESEILSALLGPAIAKERAQAFDPIVTTHGETMHCESYGHVIGEGDLVLIDCGAESAHGYCADITRTYCAGDSMSPVQREVYAAVLAAQRAGIAATAVRGASQRDVHFAACRALTEVLQGLGLMRGDVEESVQAGAHALFLPHGIGHMLGLDAHDMENYGDDVGYAPGESRSTQFGLNALRLARRLEPGFVVTVEPGCYFIPELIDRWAAKKYLDAFICYSEVEKFRGFHGIRIEDDVLITETGSRILGPGIEK